MSHQHPFRFRLPKTAALALGSALSGTALAGTASWDFTTDPTSGANPIEVYQTGFVDSLGVSQYWKDAGGNPGGFLGLTWPLGSSSSIVIFPDIDDGKIVTAFTFSCDLRIGNPQQNERAADGHSINFARSDDPVFQNHSPNDFATAGAVETGTRTGLAISFDTWSGNTLPDGGDIEGIIVRVDNRTILRQGVPTRNGTCDDPTSLQTGPRDLPYWQSAIAEGRMPDAAFEAASWAGLCWKPLNVEVNDQAQVSVTWKGEMILDKFQTDFFPSAGAIVLAGRTGGADEHSHFDNLTLTTTATEADTEPPTDPSNLMAEETGAYRVVLTWDPSTDNSDRVGYELEQNGTLLTSVFANPTAELRNLTASTPYQFRVRATDVSNNKSAWTSVLNVTTVADVNDPNYAAAKVYDNIAGTAVDALVGDISYPDNPTRTLRLNAMAMSYGDPLFGDTFGENLGVRIAGTVTPPATGAYRFFVRSDDASRLYLNTTGPTLPDAFFDAWIAEETGCCNAFQDPGATQTSEPVNLTAGQKYGILFLVKEGGGGDWGQVAWRREGDTTAPANLAAIGAPYFESEAVPKSDPVGAVVNITQQPQSVVTPENQPVSFSVTADWSSPYATAPLYQWFKNGTVIPGANTASLMLPSVTSADNGSKYTVSITVPGKSVTSAEATLTIGVLSEFTSIKQNADGTITVEWTGGGTLETAPAVTGPWAPVTGATSPYTFTPTAPALFGRIRQ